MRRRIGAILFLAIAILIAVLAYGRLTERSRILADLRSAGIVVDPSDSISLLRLQWYLAAQRIDPIFAIDGTDPDQLREALSILYEKEDAFTSYYPADERSILKNLYPADFLNELPALEARRGALFADPSLEAAQAYQYQLDTATRAYADDARALAKAVRASTSTTATFVFTGQTTTIDAFAGALTALAQSASEQRAKASERFACLSYYALSCASLHQLLADRPAMISVPPRGNAPDTTVRGLDALLGQINAQMWPTYSTRTLPPLIVEHSPCYSYPTTYARVWWETLPEGGDARKQSVANDIYLDDILPGLNGVYAAAYAQGARYKYQISGHYYLCVDSGIEVARTDADLEVYAALKQDIIFATSTDPNLAAQEQAIRSAVYIDSHDIAQYIHDAAALIAARGSAPIAQEIGAANIDRLESAINQYREGSAQFDDVVREVAFESEFMSLFQKEQRIPIPSLLLLRSAASVLFLSGNQTFSPQHVSFASGLDDHPLSFSHMTSYNDLLLSGSTSAQVVGALLNTARIEQSLLP